MIGLEHILNYLKKSIEKNRVSHAYLFVGPEQLERKEIALWFAKSLGCQGPDITEIGLLEDKKEISIEQIRKLRRYLSLSPHSSPSKVAVIDEAEKMTPEAANALLKTLEEPRGNTVLILITNLSSALPDTIISRCETIKFRAPSLDKFFKDSIKKEHVDILQKPLNDIFIYLEKITSAQGRPASGWKEGSQIIPVLNSWLFWFREKMKKDAKYAKITKEIQRTKDLILNTNINKRLALENLALCIKS